MSGDFFEFLCVPVYRSSKYRCTATKSTGRHNLHVSVEHDGAVAENAVIYVSISITADTKQFHGVEKTVGKVEFFLS